MNLKLTFGKILSLNDVLYVPEMRYNLISVSVLGKASVKVIFENDEVVLTKCGNLVGKGHYCDGLFLLNVSCVMNENTCSNIYLTNSIDLWHSRLGHVNFSYLKKMKELGIINDMSITNNEKCPICVEAKSTKKMCKPV